MKPFGFFALPRIVTILVGPAPHRVHLRSITRPPVAGICGEILRHPRPPVEGGSRGEPCVTVARYSARAAFLAVAIHQTPPTRDVNLMLDLPLLWGRM